MFLTLVTIFSSSFVLALSGALMPGPVLTVTISESARRGAIVGPLIILGHGMLELLLVLALLAGLAPLLTRSEVFAFISLSGGGILLWMSYTMFRNLPGMKLNVRATDEKPRNLVLAGILLTSQPLLDHMVGNHWYRLYCLFDSIWDRRDYRFLYRTYPRRSRLVQYHFTGYCQRTALFY